MNQQSDSSDLLGGFKPVDVRHIIKPFNEDFEILFCKSFSRKQNVKFLGHLQECFSNRKWETLFSLMEHTTKSALQKFKNDKKTLKKWEQITKRLSQLKLQVQQTQNALAFTFMEGTLVKAIRSGEWVLLDEINLAATETLECLSGLLEKTSGSLLLMERGDIEPVVRHPDFRLFACMNPATDVGKKDLSHGIRNRFTELYVDELEDENDLKILVCDYLQGLSLTTAQVDGIVKFYLSIRNEASKKLTDGTGHPPHYSLRTLCRALRYAARNSCGSVPRSLYEGFCLSFLTQLDRSSHPMVEQLVRQHVLGKTNIKSILKQVLPIPSGDKKYLQFEGYWVCVGDKEPTTPDDYILTPSVRANLKDLVRVVAAGQHPVLLQGETSVGKTSLIKWLSQSSGNICVRVNNHEHTDLQEYVGCYAADENGKLAFKEGVLVEAMRKGHWIILDELNLAPTDVLEALNRLLDDNRELYIPETQDTVKAHPKFMLFATQNPPGQYGGRKLLSRAFRNRFVELHFDEIPSKELETILHERCDIPLSYARRLVAVMLELQTRRRGSGVFAGKMGFMTLRDLFRWAGRYKCPEMDKKKFYDWDKHLADQGYMLLAGRVRKPEESEVIKEVIQKHFKCKVNPDTLFTLSSKTSLTCKSTLENILEQSVDGFNHIVWTYSMRRLAVLIGQAIQYKEPILLVGETGCGKTTVCQLYAALYNTLLHSVNCHLHTESTDFLGGLRPVRVHSEEGKKDKLFEWVDGPLVQAMKEGAMFLIDEISLADDSVLERLNSVLEFERTILLAEKGGGDGNQNEVEQVVAMDGFHVFATMNPGGDFGKKELSPALRNRFTEIWCPAYNNRQDLIDIIEHNLHTGIHLCNQQDGTSGIGRAIMEFVEWFSNNELGKRCTVSIRDILTWVQFINTCSKTMDTDVTMTTDDITSSNQLDPALAYIHGACLVFLDGLGAGTTSQGKDDVVGSLRKTCLLYLLRQVNTLTHQTYDLNDLCLLDTNSKNKVYNTEDTFCIPPFSIPKGTVRHDRKHQYALDAPGPCINAQRVLRALQLSRPLLLEGSPGVGKTSLVAAIARVADRDLVRINLSEQTDVTDLFGADLPVEGSEGGIFAWRDGPLLQALKNGSWIVLDELNLASQSVLEGLNACLDHRAEIYIPELGKTFHIQHEHTRLFACQNPLNQGGGRKGLPRSFLNRFTQVYVEALSSNDLMFITSSMYPMISSNILSNMVQFNMKIHEETVIKNIWGQRGSPWEFNLRDLFRWCDLLVHNQVEGEYNPGEYVGMIYVDRMRTINDKLKVYELYSNIFGSTDPYKSTGVFHFDGNLVQVGHSFLNVKGEGHLHGNKKVNLELLHQCMPHLESLMKCMEMNWMAILVGPSYSGKSSLVEILSQLTGHQLNILAMNSAMDTTELLGGFEQADDKRHIEELATKVNIIVHQISNQCLLHENTGCLDMVTKAFELWEDYKKKQISGNKSSNIEEIELMKSQLEVLLQIIVLCKKIIKKYDISNDVSEDILHVKQKIKQIKQKLSTLVSGGGGAFEWIDSLLVKSLRDGHWLLIDNVNFCSASVLDRLNALLEPHGVLSINERGVIDGKIPTIKPHPNFRLILSMDPRHGEISRAMRNRGIEIYIPGETDGCCFNDLDLRRIVNGVGLKSKPVFDWLLNLQQHLYKELSRGDKPGIQDMLQVCYLIVELCNHGNDIQSALRSACYSVYVQQQRHTLSRQKSMDILQSELDNLSDIDCKKSLHIELGIYPVRLPSILDIVNDNVCAMVCRNTALFTYLVQTEQTSTNNQSTSKLKSALNILLQHCTKKNIDITIDWLQKFYENSNISDENVYYSITSLQKICSSMMVARETLGVDTCLNKLTNGRANDCIMDMRWNHQMLQQIVYKYDGENVDQLSSNLETSFNRLFISQRFQVEMSILLKHMKILEDALQRDKGKVKQTVHEAIAHLVALYPLLVTRLTDLIPTIDISTFDETTKALEYLYWITRLYQTASSTLVHPHTAGSMLSLYWKWFNDKTLSNHFSDIREDKSISAIISILEDILGKDDQKWKIFTKFWRSIGHPMPFKDKGRATKVMETWSLCRLFDLSNIVSEIVNHSKVKLITNHRQTLVDYTMRLLSEDMTDQNNEDEIDDVIDNLQILLRKYGLISRDENMVAMDTDDHVTDINQSDCENKDLTELPLNHVQLWPVFDYLAVLESWSMVVYEHWNRQFGYRTSDKRPDTMVDYMSQYTPQSPVDIYQFKKLLKDDNILYSCAVGHSLHMLRKSTCILNTSTWLDWSGQLTEEMNIIDDTTHKVYVHQPLLSYMTCVLLSRADNSISMTTPANVKINASLKNYKREINKLQHLSRYIWSHVATISNTNRQPITLDRECFFQTLIHTLKSCACFVDEGMSQDIEALFDTSTYQRCQDNSDIKRVICRLLESCSNMEPETRILLQELGDSLPLSYGNTYFDIGVAWIHLGQFCLKLLAPQGPVDPVEKIRVKLEILKDELSNVETELDVICEQHRLVTGQDLLELPFRLVHPHVLYLRNQSAELMRKIKELEDHIAYRPSISQYMQLVTDIKNFMSSVVAVDTVNGLALKLRRISVMPSSNMAVLQEVELWEKSVDKFITMIETEYPCYHDITTPYLSALHQLVHGMMLLYHYGRYNTRLISVVKETDLKTTRNLLESLVINVGKYPTISVQQPTCDHLARTLTSDTNLSLLKTVLINNTDDEVNPTQIAIDSLLTSSLLHLQNSANVRREMTPDLLITFTKILETYVSSWQQAEEEKKLREEQEASLYRYKSQTHGDERSEEEQLEAEFKQYYPEFTGDYADIVAPNALEDSTVVQSTPEDNNDLEQTALKLSNIQMTQIAQIHQQMYKQLVDLDWYKPSAIKPLHVHDWIKPILSSYTACSILCKQWMEVLSNTVDNKVLGGHIITSTVQQYYILQSHQQTTKGLLEDNVIYDIYHDSYIPQVIQCLPVLSTLRNRVQELQQEWPDHPTLKQICDVCGRIESFPITCPVIKFLTGLELLLQTAQEWECNASQHVSMATQLADISRLIVQWRKLELDCWMNSLNTEIKRYESTASKWWFHLYQVIMSYLKQQDSEESCSLNDVIKSLKQFIEHSTLGDYHTRLDMLLGYHCHLVAMSDNMKELVAMETDSSSDDVTEQSKRQELQCTLWNMYKFYGRFSETVKLELEKLRAPIEKELKGFVKIARWSDINYWALKQASEKTHRTLHKHLKQFQEILRQPVQGILRDIDNEETKTDNSNWSDKLTHYQQQLIQTLQYYKITLTVPDIIQTICTSEIYPLQYKLSHLSSRLNKHWLHIINTSRYSQHIVTLDQFTGELIENIHELQALDVNRNEEKEKQKSEAKHINLRKRKSLSDLFKYLAKLGLSYRKGLTVTDSYDEALKVPPVDLCVALPDDDSVQNVWAGSLNYFYKCLSRRAQFLNALVTPSKELGIANIERCRGFTEHLYILLIQQHRDISNITQQYKHVSERLSYVEQLYESRRNVFSMDEAKSFMESIKSLTVSVIEGLNQFNAVLECCPSKQGEINHHPSPKPSEDIHCMALVNNGDEKHMEALTQVQSVISEIMLIQNMLPVKQSDLLTWNDVEVLRNVINKMAAISPRMQQLAKLFNDPDSSHPNAFTDVIYFLCNEITDQSKKLNTWIDNVEENCTEKKDIDSNDLSQFADDVEQIVSSILLVIQKQTKLHTPTDTETMSEIEDIDELVDGHLVKIIYDKLQQDNLVLDDKQINRRLESLIDAVIRSSTINVYKSRLEILYHCTPILYQYKNILHHHLISILATERTMGKLLSVLLGVFTELATKGFCIPPELSDEMSGEGATEFCDIDNAGMGEGEGVKNVSDQIEDEDQLDEAKRPEDHKKEEESNQPDVKSEENAIEMSDDIDAKVQDLEDVDKQEEDEDDNNDDEEEVDKQMGEVDEEDTEKLDEQMWGSDDETENKEEEKEETGPGDGKESKPELVAKDDNVEESDENNDDKNENQDEEEEDTDDKEKQNNLDIDQENYDDDQVDPYHGKQEEQQAPDDLDLPDDLNLDDNEDGGKEETENMEESVEPDKEDDDKLPPDGDDDDENGENNDENKEQNEEKEGDDNGDDENTKDDVTDTNDDNDERKEDEGENESGINPQDESAVDTEEHQDEADDITPSIEHYGKTSHDASDDVEQCETAQDAAGETTENDQQEVDGTGQASADQDEGHQGQRSTSSIDSSSQGKRKQEDRQPGQSDNDRSLGSTDQKYKRLKTTDTTKFDENEDNENKEEESKISDTYEHIKDSTTHYDKQTLDVATSEQLEQQEKITPDNNDDDDDDDDNDDDTLINNDKDEPEVDENVEISSSKLRKNIKDKQGIDDNDDVEDVDMDTDVDKEDIPGERVLTDMVARGNDSTIHTALEYLHLDNNVFELEQLRSELESELGSWTQSNQPSDIDTESSASDLWHRYEALTSSLSQDLCEQLRLVLEPSQATKLKGDYRTGKRLNMRKVIPYIASEFRKDKIWLRRTKPCKRQYQIMLAIDDSSSMVDNHSKQMAFESLALISNALTLLEAGELSICSFGETVNVLHPFNEQFTSLSGAHLLQYLTFEQKKTKIAQLLKHATAMMMDARNKQHGFMGNVETSQLLVIMSDGRGLFMEGMEVVKSAVRQAREANVFIVFVIIDNPDNKDSILDIRVPVFKQGGQLPEIKSYMDSFPFPFYIILRDINSLPVVLSDALRQWFELVTAVDR
ncbi:AAA ATPase midasin [Mactra antiquata]